MAKYTIRWMAYGPRAVKPEEVLSILRMGLPGWTPGTATIATVAATGTVTGPADPESGVAEGQITGPSGWGTGTAATPARIRAITTGSGVTVEVTPSGSLSTLFDNLTTEQSRTIRRSLNATADALLGPLGFLGDNRGWRIRAIGEAEDAYPVLVAAAPPPPATTPSSGSWFPLLAIAVFAGAAYFASRDRA